MEKRDIITGEINLLFLRTINYIFDAYTLLNLKSELSYFSLLTVVMY